MDKAICLVTGADGFIGSNLLAGLTNLERFGLRGAVRRESGKLPGGVDRMVVGELGPDTDWQQILTGVDAVVHLAARVHVMREEATDPLTEFRRVNVAGTLNLAQQAVAAGVRRFVFISSIGVNGNETQSAPFSEANKPNPGEAYTVSKWEAEEGLKRLATQVSMEIVIIRPPLVYGSNAPGNFGRLYRLVRRQLPLPFGAVHNRRSLVAMENLLDFIITCIEHPAAADETFLVSDGEDLSTTDLIRRLARAMGRPVRLIPVPVPLLMAGATLLGKREVAQRLLGSLQVDISKARQVLGWVPPISVDEGLKRAVSPLRGSQ